MSLELKEFDISVCYWIGQVCSKYWENLASIARILFQWILINTFKARSSHDISSKKVCKKERRQLWIRLQSRIWKKRCKVDLTRFLFSRTNCLIRVSKFSRFDPLFSPVTSHTTRVVQNNAWKQMPVFTLGGLFHTVIHDQLDDRLTSWDSKCYFGTSPSNLAHYSLWNRNPCHPFRRLISWFSIYASIGPRSMMAR
jgi:hypothetical protein